MALSGVRVIDLTRILAGPFCSVLLADMGADVIKIESPKGGDPVRQQGAKKNGLSWYFAQFNRNKKSLTLNLYSDKGKSILAKLLTNADVLVENYRPGVLAKMGFGKEYLQNLNPNLIVTSINGYGSTGPYADRPSFDFIAQAMSGFMGVNGIKGDPPMRAAPPISDLMAGLYAAFGTVCALYKRDQPISPNVGQRVETSLVNSLVSMMAYLSAEYFVTDKIPERTGNDHPIVAPYGLFNASDGNVAIAASNDAIVYRLFDALNLLDLLEKPDFANNEKRVANRISLNKIINEKIATHTVKHWVENLNLAGVPCSCVLSLKDVFCDPQIQNQEMALDIEHPGRGLVRMTGFPVKLDKTPAALRYPAPELGYHTNSILEELGFDVLAINELKTEGII